MSVEKTQEVFENIIKKPQLTSQLLSRPPFKFIVDIVSNVIKSTGYLKNDFTDDEINSAGTDKNSKSAFLEKLIKILDDGSLQNVKAAKIISGKDAEETNKMLQRLGMNAKSYSAQNGTTGEEKKKKKVKKEDKKESKKESKNEEKEEIVSTKKRISKKDAHSEEKEKSERKKPSEEKEKEKKKKTSSSKERHKSREKSIENSSEKSEKKEKKKEKADGGKPKKSKKEPSERVFKRQDSMIAVNGDAPDTPPQDEGYDEEIQEPRAVFSNADSDLTAQIFTQPATSPLKTDDSGIGDSPRLIKPEDSTPLVRPMTGAAGGRPMTSMGRPGTATSRPAPPKLKKKQIATVDSTPAAVIELKSEIISDTIPKLDLKEDESTFIIEDDENDEERTARVAETVNEEDRGALVQKILETKAEIEDVGVQEQLDEAETDKVVSAEKEKVRQLQEKLQDLTRSAYPLARLFDFANDDIESMVKELERWRSEQRRNEQEEQNKKAAGFGDSSRFYNIIANLQKEIHEMKDELSRAKGRVLHNEKRIQLFISNV